MRATIMSSRNFKLENPEDNKMIYDIRPSDVIIVNSNKNNKVKDIKVGDGIRQYLEDLYNH